MSELPPTTRFPAIPAQNGDAPPDLREWLVVLRDHWKLLASVAAVVLGAAGYVAYTSPRLYRAKSVIRLVDARRALVGTLVGSAGTDVAVRSADPVLSQVEVLRSRATAAAVVDDMPTLRTSTDGFPAAIVTNVELSPGAERDSVRLEFGDSTVKARRGNEEREVAYGAPMRFVDMTFTVTERPRHQAGTLYVVSRERAINAVTGGLLVKPRENTDVIDIIFTASEAHRAQLVANHVAAVFQAGNAQAAQQEARRRREFIETQLRFNDSLLTTARRALSDFRARGPSAADRPIDALGFAGLEARRGDLDIERRQLTGEMARLEDTSTAVRREALRNVIAASPTIAANPVVSGLYAQLGRYEHMRDSLTTGDWARATTNPDVQRLAPLIASTETDLVGAVQSVAASLDARIGVLDDLRARSVGAARRQSGIQATEDALTEQVENARRIAGELRAEYERARIAVAVEVGQVEIVDLAPLPDSPIGVARSRMLMFGLLLGLLLGGGSAFVADRLNPSVHRRDHIAQLGLPVLGIVPHAKQSVATATSSTDAAPIVEAMRGIRFNLLHAYGAAGPVVFTLTSPGTREGKSFVAVNLALAFADQGHKTLLIDGDLRRGSLYRVLNGRRKPGLTDALHDEVPHDSIVQSTPYAPLYFVGCGTRTPDAPELLGSAAMTTFLGTMRQNFGVIIVDSPPLGAGVDAFALGAVTGNMLMVLRMGTTDREIAEAKLDLLGRLPVRLLGAVLNDVPPHSPYQPYSYYMEGYAYEAERGRVPRAIMGAPRK